MMTDYNQCATLFAGTAALPFRSHVEGPLIFRALGDTVGKTILDLACGDGFYTRVLKRSGAARVVGVDTSKEMINTAATAEENDRLGVEYTIHDVGEMPILGAFDLATAVYMTPYARSREHLLRMCENIHANLRPGGRFVALVNNPSFRVEGPNCTKYGMTIHIAEPREDQAVLTIDFHTSPPFAVRNLFWTRPTLERSFTDAGFRDIVWLRPEPPASGDASFDREFWRGYIDNPHAIIIRGEA